MSDQPAIFPIWIQICNLEDSEFLPSDISNIIWTLIQIRLKSEARYQEDYVPNEGSEDCTQFYPNFPIHTWPKLYNIGSSIDKDSCDNNFREAFQKKINKIDSEWLEMDLKLNFKNVTFWPSRPPL